MNPKIKSITHVFAGVAVAIWGFALTPAGQALAKQYPHVGAVVAGISTVLALYHQPQEN